MTKDAQPTMAPPTVDGCGAKDQNPDATHSSLKNMHTAPQSSSEISSWMNMYDQLRFYQQKHGHCDVPSHIPKHHSLAKLSGWVRTQRTQYRWLMEGENESGKRGNMTASRISLLEKIGFRWSWSTAPRAAPASSPSTLPGNTSALLPLPGKKEKKRLERKGRRAAMITRAGGKRDRTQTSVSAVSSDVPLTLSSSSSSDNLAAHSASELSVSTVKRIRGRSKSPTPDVFERVQRALAARNHELSAQNEGLQAEKQEFSLADSSFSKDSPEKKRTRKRLREEESIRDVAAANAGRGITGECSSRSKQIRMLVQATTEAARSVSSSSSLAPLVLSGTPESLPGSAAKFDSARLEEKKKKDGNGKDEDEDGKALLWCLHLKQMVADSTTRADESPTLHKFVSSMAMQRRLSYESSGAEMALPLSRSSDAREGDNLRSNATPAPMTKERPKTPLVSPSRPEREARRVARAYRSRQSTHSLDAEMKRAMRNSIVTFRNEASNRRLLAEAELALGEMGNPKPTAVAAIASAAMRSSTLVPKVTNARMVSDCSSSTAESLAESSISRLSNGTLAAADSPRALNAPAPPRAAASSDVTINTVDASSPTVPPFTPSAFERLWHVAERRLGATTEEIEQGSLVRGSNNVDRSSNARKAGGRKGRRNGNYEGGLSAVQTRAQYGRTLFPGVKRIIEMTSLRSDEIFLDIGHGIGSACLQASFTVGCESRGIEVVPERCRVAEMFRRVLMSRVEEMNAKKEGRPRTVGKVELREGSLTDPRHRPFLSEADVVLVNNSHDIFGTRSGDVEGRPTLDSYVGGIFASLNPGARMVTFHPLLCLGRDLSEENERRRKAGLTESLDASFFTAERRSIGMDVVSWSTTKDITVYLYTRVNQSSSDGGALFLCGNKGCAFGSRHGTSAVSDVSGLLLEECVYCGSKRTVKTRR